ncbi:shikimate dehydrogenase [Rubritalea squalenifaciens DSM 18772]|uniref:Shikimate dehydrogenase (NADP(+)) n=1 Tax=Rubritalea squalenifaciens DSM 18772 TaxID=1123071 RepID=A0A1M6EU67_9BACT|nr:shikimate dehydrogenase [Rubritalea squalenifaciens]SHI89054.1 shikimate dehydrogenase [Rubritalea squalenifaciens DSM 18772]
MSKPPRLAVIGHPVSHSASPRMHQPALDDAGVDASYIAIDVEPGKVKEAFSKMQEEGYIGCNVTVPHKLEAMEICDELTDDAKALGATNTIVFREDGTILGHNTDGAGLSQAILEDFGKSLSELRILILGAGGGAGRAIATQCCREGAPAVYLSNRTIEKLEPIAIDLVDNHGGKLVTTLSTDTESLIEAASRVDLIINATSLGLKPSDPLPLPEEALLSRHMVYDAIYNPPVTPLLKAASEVGAKTSNGLSMLLHQGAFAFEAWFGIKPNLELMHKALLQK